MRLWITEFWAVSVVTQELTAFAGPRVRSLTQDMAQKWCNENAPWLEVKGMLVQEVSEEGNSIDYEQQIYN